MTVILWDTQQYIVKPDTSIHFFLSSIGFTDTLNQQRNFDLGTVKEIRPD